MYDKLMPRRRRQLLATQSLLKLAAVLSRRGNAPLRLYNIKKDKKTAKFIIELDSHRLEIQFKKITRHAV